MAEQRVFILLGANPYYNREVLSGIGQFAAAHANTYCSWSPSHPDLAPLIRAWRPDGVIAQIVSRADPLMLRDLGCPVVNVANVRQEPSALPRVGFDEEGVGRAVAEHFLERGLRHFGFAGLAEHQYTLEREAGFRAALAAAKCSCSTLPIQTGFAQWRDSERLILEWLTRLPLPAGIMAATDTVGVHVAHSCRQAGRRVPEDIAVVGVDDDKVICDLARPPLSSVGIPIRRAGYEAAALLSGLIDGQPAPLRPILLPHTGLVTRHSSDALAIDDPELAAAVRFIRSNAHRAISVADVLEHAPVSRRTLERRFREVLGRSILAEIRRTRLEHAKRLLSSTDLPLRHIARRSGFASEDRFATLFRRETGLTPTAFRRQF